MVAMVMRGGRRAWWVGVVVLLLAKSTWGNFIVYKLGEPGMCTGFVKTLSTLTDTCCAMACSASKFVNSIFTSLQKKKKSYYSKRNQRTDWRCVDTDKVNRDSF